MSNFFKPSPVEELLAKAEQTTNTIVSKIGPVALVSYDQAVPNFYDEVLSFVIKHGSSKVSVQDTVKHLSTAIKPTAGDTLIDLPNKRAQAAVDTLDQVVKAHTEQAGQEAATTPTISLN